MVICLERGADLHMAQLMPLPLTFSCSSKIQIGFSFLVPAYPGCPGKEAVKCLLVVDVCTRFSFLLCPRGVSPLLDFSVGLNFVMRSTMLQSWRGQNTLGGPHILRSCRRRIPQGGSTYGVCGVCSQSSVVVTCASLHFKHSASWLTLLTKSPRLPRYHVFLIVFIHQISMNW